MATSSSSSSSQSSSFSSTPTSESSESLQYLLKHRSSSTQLRRLICIYAYGAHLVQRRYSSPAEALIVLRRPKRTVCQDILQAVRAYRTIQKYRCVKGQLYCEYVDMCILESRPIYSFIPDKIALIRNKYEYERGVTEHSAIVDQRYNITQQRGACVNIPVHERRNLHCVHEEEYPMFICSPETAKKTVKFSTRSMCTKFRLPWEIKIVDILPQTMQAFDQSCMPKHRGYISREAFISALVDKKLNNYEGYSVKLPVLGTFTGFPNDELRIYNKQNTFLTVPRGLIYVPRQAVCVGIGTKSFSIVYVFADKVMVQTEYGHNRLLMQALQMSKRTVSLVPFEVQSTMMQHVCILTCAYQCYEFVFSQDDSATEVLQTYLAEDLSRQLHADIVDRKDAICNLNGIASLSEEETVPAVFRCTLCVTQRRNKYVVCPNGHTVCYVCNNKWLNVVNEDNVGCKTCPICRAPMYEEIKSDLIYDDLYRIIEGNKKVIPDEHVCNIDNDWLQEMCQSASTRRLSIEEMRQSLRFTLGMWTMPLWPKSNIMCANQWLEIVRNCDTYEELCQHNQTWFYLTVYDYDGSSCDFKFVTCHRNTGGDSMYYLPMGIAPPCEDYDIYAISSNHTSVVIDTVTRQVYLCGLGGSSGLLYDVDDRYVCTPFKQSLHGWCVRVCNDFKFMPDGLDRELFDLIRCIRYPKLIPPCDPEVICCLYRNNQDYSINGTHVFYPNARHGHIMVDSGTVRGFVKDEFVFMTESKFRESYLQVLKKWTTCEACGQQATATDEVYRQRHNGRVLCRSCINGECDSLPYALIRMYMNTDTY